MIVTNTSPHFYPYKDGVRRRKLWWNHCVSLKYCIVDKRTIWQLSATFIFSWPYKYKCDWFPKWLRLYFCKIFITLAAKVALWVAKRRHENRKWLVSSIPSLQRHTPEGVSMNLWHVLWYLKELKPTLNWKRYWSPKGDHVYQKCFLS